MQSRRIVSLDHHVLDTPPWTRQGWDKDNKTVGLSVTGWLKSLTDGWTASWGSTSLGDVAPQDKTPHADASESPQKSRVTNDGFRRRYSSHASKHSSFATLATQISAVPAASHQITFRHLPPEPRIADPWQRNFECHVYTKRTTHRTFSTSLAPIYSGVGANNTQRQISTMVADECRHRPNWAGGSSKTSNLPDKLLSQMS